MHLSGSQLSVWSTAVCPLPLQPHQPRKTDTSFRKMGQDVNWAGHSHPIFSGAAWRWNFLCLLNWCCKAVVIVLFLPFCDASSFQTCNASHVFWDLISEFNFYLCFFPHIIFMFDYFYLQRGCVPLAPWLGSKSSGAIVCEKCFCGENPPCMGGEKGRKTM